MREHSPEPLHPHRSIKVPLLKKSLFLVFCLALPLLVQAAQPLEEIKAQVDQYVEQNFANQAQVGMVVGVASEEASAIWSYGERIRGEKTLPTANTYFEIGSITKTFTATLLALEVVRDRVRLDTPIKKLWPELSGFDAGEITLEQLAVHRSGLPRLPTNFSTDDFFADDPYRNYDLELMLVFLKEFKFPEKPCQTKEACAFDYEYSNLGSGLLGFLLAEKLNQMTFEAYLKRELLTPLQMSDTHLRVESLDPLRSAHGYNSLFRKVPFWTMNVLSPAGVLKTTAKDFIKYLRFQLEADSSSELGRAVLLTHEKRNTTDSTEVDIGLVWESYSQGDLELISHGGATGGYRAQITFDRKKKLGYFTLANFAESPKCIAAAVYAYACEVPKYLKLNSAEQASLAGDYSNTEYDLHFKIWSDGDLMIGQLRGQTSLRLWPVTPQSLAVPSVGALLNFTISGEDPRAKKLILLQNKNEIPFDRVGL